uniref:NADH dehydrogenase subunit 4L n=1 Tax=Mongoloniscus sinensis TaxID=1783568 RepID=A0A3G3LKN1_9CRUS|nr:NADH dehydrogenase subunit 4L [Mongoloniscus sinensis]AYQ93276.1 NADH dehydrogenase subunit 4L [Mongoloniscus sinensis]
MYLTCKLIFIYMFILAFLAFTMEFKHLLSTLAYLEFIALIIFMMMASYTYSIYNELFYSFMYISVAVCEAAVGLSITIVYTNKKGNEMFKTF